MIVLITRKFRVATSLDNKTFVSEKLKELGANIWDVRFHTSRLGKYEISRVYFECSAGEEELDRIIEHFQLNYNGVISFTF